ncbi:MAG: short-subunit dehydrogenase, partial [Planctomycetota bacterium]
MQDLATCNPFIILGATGATGQQLARDLHERGAKLRLLARDETKLNELADSLNAERTVLAGADAISIRDAMLAACADGPAAGVAHCIGS